MAQVTIDAAVNTETDEEKDGHLRSLSNGYSDDQIRVAKRESRYRSPCRGSCHDLCKHGFKSDPETKVGRSLARRNSLDSTRKTAKTFAVTNKEIPEPSKQASVSLRRQTSSPAQIECASEKHSRVPRPKTSSASATQRLRRRHSERIIPKSSEPLSVSSAGGSVGQKDSEKKVNKETEKKKIPGREKFSSSSMSSAKRILRAQSDYVKKLKKVPSVLDYRKRIKEVDNKYPPSKCVIEKTPHVIGPQARRNQDVRLAKRGSSTSSKVSEDKGLGYGDCKVNASYSPPTENTHTSLSSLKSQSSTSSSPEAMQSDESAFENDNSESEYSTTELEVENMRTPRIQVLRLKNKDRPSSHKLQFRRGSVIDVQLEDLRPSRLKFRHQEALDEEISDTECISLRRISSDGVLYETDSETEKVTLKHQEMEAREETRGLVNDVIEETANRLVRSRKSKVKALVGAFEAVLGSPR
ncbi:hypothetical protein POM88_039012 [Heracleum sosnowskyi]|uniref:Calmodulin-binding domain-containing protein n=1 Tax=Heracleum sosnowskyi TaxID=360622 RepID=A0AAD8M7F9_9APIA|nr:hypothetical protein POM88_039012 [Heracleum sosnowskyi]